MLSPVARPNFVSSAWGSDRSYRGEGKRHEGLDFRAAIGDPVFAVDEGMVITSKNGAPDPAGEFISILHPSGILSRYMHLSQRLVGAGDHVRAGQLIAKSGRSGITTSAAHLHFDLKLKPDQIGLYTGRFGVPTTGFFPPSYGYVGIPAEPFIPVDQWQKGLRERASLYRIPLYTAGLGLVGYGLLLTGVYFLAKG